MKVFAYEILENIAFYIPLGFFLIGVLLLQGVITAVAQKRNEKFQRSLMAEEAKKTAAILNQTALIERQTVALEKLAAELGGRQRRGDGD
jgi:hypothetical protein